jgi:hypothetical protein
VTSSVEGEIYLIWLEVAAGTCEVSGIFYHPIHISSGLTDHIFFMEISLARLVGEEGISSATMSSCATRFQQSVPSNLSERINSINGQLKASQRNYIV